MTKSTERSRPASVCLSTEADLDGHLDAIVATGGAVTRDPVAGIATGVDGDGATILQALQKGRRGPWILMFYDSASVTWRPATTPRRSEP